MACCSSYLGGVNLRTKMDPTNDAVDCHIKLISIIPQATELTLELIKLIPINLEIGENDCFSCSIIKPFSVCEIINK